MPSFDIDFEVYCASCNTGICRSVKVIQNNKNNILEIQPCKECLDDAKNEGDVMTYYHKIIIV